MWNKIALLSLLAFLISAPAHAQAPPVQANPQTSASVRIEGEILDARTGAALEGVYVRQQDALVSSFSDAQGKFRLDLAPGYAPTVLFQAEGYETVALPFTASQQRLRIHLQPLKQFTSDLPSAHSPQAVRAPSPIFGNQFSAFYQLDYTIFAQQNVFINGLVLNELGLSADLLTFAPVGFRAKFFRSRQPVDVANFPFTPAFFINHNQAKLAAGVLHKLDNGSELFLGGDFMYDNRSPDNRNNQDNQPVPFTGSLLDSEQNRLGLGLNAALGFKLHEKVALFPEISLYPAMINLVTNGSPHYMVAGDLGAKLRVELSPGVYAIGSYNTQLWYSFGPGAFENNHFFHIGISLDPWAIAGRKP